MLARAREMIVREKLTVTLRRLADLVFAQEELRFGELDTAVELARAVLDEQFTTGEMIFRGTRPRFWSRPPSDAGQTSTSREPGARWTA